MNVDPVVVLVDDIRSFRDGRDCHVARTAEAAVQLLTELRHTAVDELWLDFDLGAGTTAMPVVAYLVEAAEAGRPLPIRRVRVHSSNLSGAREMVTRLRSAGYPVERERQGDLGLVDRGVVARRTWFEDGAQRRAAG